MSDDAPAAVVPQAPAAPGAEAPAVPAARCAAHPGAPAAYVCARCGAFICVACASYQLQGFMCPACASRLERSRTVSWLAITSAGLGFLGLGLPILGPIALGLATLDLVRISSKTSPVAGWKLDLMGLALGLLGCVVWAAIIYRFATNPSASFDGP